MVGEDLKQVSVLMAERVGNLTNILDFIRCTFFLNMGTLAILWDIG